MTVLSTLLNFATMNAKDFLAKHGKERAEQVSLKAGTTFAYFLQLVYGNRFPSRKLASLLEESSEGEMTWQELLSGTSQPPSPEASDARAAA